MEKTFQFFTNSQTRWTPLLEPVEQQSMLDMCPTTCKYVLPKIAISSMSHHSLCKVLFGTEYDNFLGWPNWKGCCSYFVHCRWNLWCNPAFGRHERFESDCCNQHGRGGAHLPSCRLRSGGRSVQSCAGVDRGNQKIEIEKKRTSASSVSGGSSYTKRFNDKINQLTINIWRETAMVAGISIWNLTATREAHYFRL